MSRRKHRFKTTFNQELTPKEQSVPPEAINKEDNILINARDITYSLFTGLFCIALLVGLSEIIHKTNWLTPLINKFNSLI